ncbi:endonuclease [Nitrospirillum viridazoti CBAmc]|uniref:Endonuclease n=2 Tax=Nitrospirillum TaxID=1543705 RepID=A0A248JXI1_9PROT|nr:endonuclease [Nitrospirillum amazonense CBAmc]
MIEILHSLCVFPANAIGKQSHQHEASAMRHHLSAALIALSVLPAMAPTQAFAWGGDGHRTVAAIAYQLLTPTAKAQVNGLLGDDSGQAFINAATWADDIRKPQPDQPYPGSGPWHYVSIPFNDAVYVKGRDCKTDSCVVEKISAFNAQLSDSQLLEGVRRDALKFVIHFVGDIHQPLHACENGDRGANEVQVTLNGRNTNLHSVWDSGIIRGSWGNIAAHQALLTQRAEAEHAKWENGTPADWATESHTIARQVVYPSLGNVPAPGPVTPPVVLPADYAAKEAPVVDEQIVKAGVRLASLLNGDFK